MAGTRCKHCELLIGMGCACAPRKNGKREKGTAGRTRRKAQSATSRHGIRPKVGKVTVVQTKKGQGASGGKKGRQRNGKRPAPAPVLRDDALAYEDDRTAEAFREEFRDMRERGTSVRTVSGGLPTLGRRRR